MKKLIILIAILLPTSLLAQDFRFSQYFAAPQFLNPAMTGVFNGDLRFAGNYRNQWSSLESFTTYSSAVDANLFKKALKGDFFGVGAAFLSDIAGTDLDYVSTVAAISLSYNKRLAKNPSQYLSIGGQAGITQRQLDIGNPLFRPYWDPAGNSDPIISSNVYSTSFVDVSTGLMWYGGLNTKTSVYGGLALFHINRPSQNLTGIDQDKLLMKTVLHGGFEYELNYQVHLLGTMLFMLQGGSQETNAGAYLKYILDENANIAVYGGGWYRLVSSEKGIGSDAFIASVKLDVKYFSLGLSYDLTLSGITKVNNMRGGPEISLVIISPFDSRSHENVKYCPRF